MQSARPGPAPKLLTDDLESSLASLVDNLTINSGGRGQQWNSPKNQPKPQNAGWQPQPMVATTGPSYKPMAQPMGAAPLGYAGGVPAPTGSPKMGAAPPQSQPVKQEVSFDPFGNL